MAHLGEGVFERGEQGALGAALKDLGDKPAARPEDRLGKSKCVLGQGDNAQMVGRGVPRRRRRHVAQYEVGRAAERHANGIGGGGIAEIADEKARPGNRVGRVEVDTDHDGVPLYGDLGPAAGSAAEIDDTPAGRQEMKAGVELDQLEGGARAKPLPLRLGDKRVVELAFQPFAIEDGLRRRVPLTRTARGRPPPRASLP